MLSSKPTVYLAFRGKGKPHVDLANLKDGDQAKAQFTNQWGRLCAENPVWDNPILWRDLLRLAWQGEPEWMEKVVSWVKTYLNTSYVFTKGRVEVNPTDFLGVVLLLFLQDHAAGKTAICENPDCKLRYFVKTRSTQKLCGLDACTAWNLNVARLNWWNKEGKKQREEKREKAKNKRRKAS